LQLRRRLFSVFTVAKFFGFSYFFPGLWHFLIALAWALALGVLTHSAPLFWLVRLEFVIPLVLSSSALFWVPDGLATKGLMKFLHYPLPDWDVLLLSPASHRHWLTHSAFLPALCFFVAWKYPNFFHEHASLSWFAIGLSTGIGSHLFWDCIGSRTHKIVIFPFWWALRAGASRLYLLAGAALALVIALQLALAK
jgi:hypothetical protein